MITESQLPHSNRVFFRGFEALRDDRNDSTGGGSALIVWNDIDCHRLQFNLPSHSFEFTAIVLNQMHGAKIVD